MHKALLPCCCFICSFLLLWPNSTQVRSECVWNGLFTRGVHTFPETTESLEGHALVSLLFLTPVRSFLQKKKGITDRPWLAYERSLALVLSPGSSDQGVRWNPDSAADTKVAHQGFVSCSLCLRGASLLQLQFFFGR